MVENYVKVIGSATGAKAQNVEWFGTDLTTQATSDQFSASKFRITIGLTEEKETQIKQAVKEVGTQYLRPIKEKIDSNITYIQIKVCLLVMKIDILAI